MFFWAMFNQWFPDDLRNYIRRYFRKLLAYFYPYITITFHEYQVDEFEQSKAYKAIERYLGTNTINRAKRLRAEVIKDSKNLLLNIDTYEEVMDEYKGIKVRWRSGKIIPQQQPMYSYYGNDEKRYYKARKHRDIVTGDYVRHVLGEGYDITRKTRQRKLYTNCKSDGYNGSKIKWSHIMFKHPSTFDTLAMDPNNKKKIMDDLLTFSKSKDYYNKVGKSWKRGYLLYGPPGTGKSSMIAAMANFLDYDIYDLELTSVDNNTELRKLLIGTSHKSIIVIEDIDCSLDLTGQRKKENADNEEEQIKGRVHEKDEKEKKSEVTLSGLLNFIDGLWSACGSERLIVFTTNHIEKLDPALIRRGRMDKHIEMSYCCFETFKVLAKNYLDIESHELFETIGRLLDETDITPADVAETLMPKSAEEDAESCLNSLIKSLENAKEKARLKTMKVAVEKSEADAYQKVQEL
ncbi:AAA-ATPase At3g28580-like [Bidens hawaiensis]|uniref:AAA-ATPase At3g28580-like n=1 Tax=Bidens hawaiensis TaxID=980011 RepID=UPI00404B42E6